MTEVNGHVVRWLDSRLEDPDLLEWTVDLLMRLCTIDTTLRSGLARLRKNEQSCFELVESAMIPYLGPSARVVQLPAFVDRMDSDPYFTKPYYAGELADRPEVVYGDRTNQYVTADLNGRRRWLLNAHIDTVPPHVPPSCREDSIVAGRGAVDDKGGVVLAVLVARLLHEAAVYGHTAEAPPVDYLISIDEEMGGNGSLAAARQLAFDNTTVVVLEPTRLQPHPANRGALWFKVDLFARSEVAQRHALACLSRITQSLAALGSRIRSESDHPLFSPEDVQTCFGRLGPFGEHPSSACSRIEIVVDGSEAAADPALMIADILEQAEAAGRIVRASTAPQITRSEDTGSFLVQLFALDGHMGSRSRDSDAIMKASEVVLNLERRNGGLCRLSDQADHIILEGGQGFVPTHSMEQVRAEMTKVFEQALEQSRRRYNLDETELDAEISFDKLHNDAYSSAPGAPGAPAIAAASAQLTGKETPELTGWQVSCDARIFARECDDVVTFGAGALEQAHQPNESIDVHDILKAAGILTLAMLSESDMPTENA